MKILDWVTSKLSNVIPALKTDKYPATVEEVLDDNIKYRPGVDESVIRFKKSKPFTGTLSEIKAKFERLNINLARVYGIEAPQVVFVRKFAYGCCYFPIGNLIVMELEKNKRYSVVTFLHEFGHALGKGERSTCRWSINLFRKHFPKSYAKLVPQGHLLMLPEGKK